MPPRMTAAQLAQTPVGRANAALLEALDATPRRRPLAQAARPVDGADTLQAWAQQLCGSDDPGLAAAARLVAGLTRDHPVRPFRIDLADVPTLTAIEINGGRWQAGGGKHAGRRDREKVFALQQAGWIVREFLTEECTGDPARVIQEIAQIVTGRRP